MTTNVPFQTPSITLLREAVERRLGHSVHSLVEIETLSVTHLHSRVSEITIRRLWGLRADGYTSVRRSTLDALAQFAGHANFDEFEQFIHRNHIESTDIPSSDAILASSLREGDTVTITWLPDRRCTLIYNGNNRFTIHSVNNSHHLLPGDNFTTSAFILHQILQLHNLTHPENSDQSTTYAIATKHGLTSIEVNILGHMHNPVFAPYPNNIPKR